MQITHILSYLKRGHEGIYCTAATEWLSKKHFMTRLISSIPSQPSAGERVSDGLSIGTALVSGFVLLLAVAIVF